MENKEWCRCAACRHKMFMYEKPKYDMMNASIEIKCSSCKRIMNVTFEGTEVIVEEKGKAE